MRIPLDRQNATPIYQQIEEYVRQSILAGSLAPETRLPAARQLAQDLGISRVTVENAYAELESDGLVSRRTGSGTYVLPPVVLPPVPQGDTQVGWPLWQHEALAVPGVQESLSTEGAPELRHPNPITFTGFGDPRHFPIKEFYKAILD